MHIHTSIINNTSLNKNDKLLDIGSGTGKHVNLFTKKNIDAIGLDKSEAMIQYSKNKTYIILWNKWHALLLKIVFRNID